jgi:hypothetical protein
MIYLLGFLKGGKEVLGTGVIPAHNIRMVIRAGNQMVVGFTNAPGEDLEGRTFGLYAIHHTLTDKPPSTIHSLPTAIPTITPTPSPIPLTPSPTPTARNVQPNNVASVEPETAISSSAIVIIAVMPVMLLAGIVIAFQIINRH